MRRKLSLLLTLAAWLLATGSHWDVAQTLAWGRMLAVNSTEMPLLAAVKKTFSTEGRCQLCKAIGAARQQQDAATGAVPREKIAPELFLTIQPESPSIFSADVTGESLLCPDVLPASCPRAAPPLPPPRALS